MGIATSRSTSIGCAVVAMTDECPAPPASAIEVANLPAPIDDHLAAILAASDLTLLGEVAELLGSRRDELVEQARQLAVGESARAELPVPNRDAPASASAPTVHPAAIANCLASLIVETGDDAGTVAIALGVPASWVRGVLTGEITRIDPDHLAAMCAALETTPGELFGVELVPHRTPPSRDRFQLAPTPPTTSAEALVDHAGFLRAEDVAQVLAALAPTEQVAVVSALARRHSQLETWADDLGLHRQGGVESFSPAPAPSGPVSYDHPDLPAAAAAAQLAILVTDTGESLEAIASAVGLDPRWARAVMDGSVNSIDADHARRLCDALELAPGTVFGSTTSPAPQALLELPPATAAQLDLGP